MKNIIFLLLSFLMVFVFIACEDTGTDPIDPGTSKGSILISSSPSGASISVNNLSTGKVTPDSITGLDPGTVTVRLQLNGYRDTTFTMNVVANMQVPVAIQLTQNAPDLQTFSNVRIYEKAAPGTLWSGLNLSAGTVHLSSAPESDIYFDGVNGDYDLKSQHLRSATTSNQTHFYLGSSTNLQDGQDAPVYLNTSQNWLFQNNNTQNYVFLYDKDEHYSKLRITAIGQGGPIDERWVEVTYIYNKTKNDPRF